MRGRQGRGGRVNATAAAPTAVGGGDRWKASGRRREREIDRESEREGE